jgi:hypothetical protein
MCGPAVFMLAGPGLAGFLHNGRFAEGIEVLAILSKNIPLPSALLPANWGATKGVGISYHRRRRR